MASAAAQAATATATLTADNHYGLYVGNEDGSELRFVGRNEMGANGSSGGFNWSDPESYSFDINVGEYIYVLAWNEDLNTDHSFIGEFETPTGSFLTNTSDWLVLAGGSNPALGTGNLPPDGEVSGLIHNAYVGALTWFAPDTENPQGTLPWGTMSEIAAAAKYIWYEAVLAGDAQYLLFRTGQVAHTPIPAALPMFAASLVGLAVLSRRRRRRA